MMGPMLHSVYDIPTAYVIAGLLYLIMPAVAWIFLLGQRSSAANWWCLGGEIFGVGILLVGMREHVPAWVTYAVATGSLYFGNLIHVYALRTELGSPNRLFVGLILGSGALAVQEYFRVGLVDAFLRFTWSLAMMACLFGWTAWLAWRVALQEDSHSARWLCGVYALASGLMGLRLLRVLAGFAHTDAVASDIDSIFTTVSGLLAGVIGSVAIVGIYLERVVRQNLKMAVAQEQRDVSDLLRVQLTKMDRQRTMAEMSAALAHELSQPLTAARMDCFVAKTELSNLKQPVPVLVESLKSLEKQIDRASQILRGIRNFIKPQAIQMEMIDLRVVVQSVMDLLPSSERCPEVSIEVSCTDAFPQVKGDAVQLSQIVLNVFRNAMQARQCDQSMVIEVGIHRQGEHMQLSIQDNGPGLTPEALTTAGSQFFTTKADGMGVGLVIARNIAKLHGGELTVSNAPSGGGRMVLVLPVLA
jgi:signal transduction histidine kinase